MIIISKSAKHYLSKLLSKKKKGTNIKLSIENKDKENLTCQIKYFDKKEENFNYTKFNFIDFKVYVKKNIFIYIKKIKIDIESKSLKDEIIIKIFKKRENLKNRISNFIKYKINSKLEYHGGFVELIDIKENMFVILKFFGGCNGCSMAKVTLKEGIEKEIKKNFPNIKGVIDITDHIHSESSFY
uniref:Fe/S biogenesis protein NfuA n=1 Tax=Wigglesworthia glossinidia brevipalpis TaxID=36870 RepID=NFUA_WIGBR|nr:RecName: Full=Fe/S biogenesis protein NfuA [Wigglesworthia glossinidia endosymbiont of Glossina brevipalpis]